MGWASFRAALSGGGLKFNRRSYNGSSSSYAIPPDCICVVERERGRIIFQSEEMVILFPERKDAENDSMKLVRPSGNVTTYLLHIYYYIY